MASINEPPEEACSREYSYTSEIVHSHQSGIESMVKDHPSPSQKRDVEQSIMKSKLESQNRDVEQSTKSKLETSVCGIVWSKIINWDRWPRFGRDTERTRIYHLWPGKNVFFFRGRIICGPDPRGFLVTTVSVVLSSWIFCVYVGNDSSSHKSGSITTFSVILTIFVLINLIIVSSIDPGIIPRNESRKIGTNYGIKSKRLVINGVEVKLKYCRICNIYRPPRSCHCAICDNCVEKFDHHCPWIGQCIGLRNYRFYLIFIFSTLMFFIYIFAFSCLKIHRRMSEARSGLFRTIGNCPETFALASFCFVGMWFLGGLASFHMYLIMLNQTACENFRELHIESRNPYNKGILRNIKEVCFVGLPPSTVNFRAEAMPICHAFGF